MHAIKTLLLLSYTFFSVTFVKAQIKTSKIEIGLTAGTLIYQGDLVPTNMGNLRTIKPAIGLYVSRTLDPYFSIRANFVTGKISSDESAFSTPAYRQQRNFSFSSSIKEFSGLLVFNPLGQSVDASRFVTPYVFAGAGLSFVRIQRDYANMDTSVFNYKSASAIGLAADTIRKPPRVIAAFPIGAGLQFQLSPQLSLVAEATYRLTATDYLDGFKYAANPRNTDHYYGLSLGVSHRLGGYKCPPAKR